MNAAAVSELDTSEELLKSLSFWTLRPPQIHTPSPCDNLDSAPLTPAPELGRERPHHLPAARSSQPGLAAATSSKPGTEHSKTLMTQRYTEPPARTHKPFPSTSLIRQTARPRLQRRRTHFTAARLRCAADCS